MSELRRELVDFDGRHTDLLEGVRDARRPTKRLLRECITLASSTEGAIAAGATWLFRAWVEAGAAADVALIEELARTLPSVDDDWARLHLCQSMRWLSVPEIAADAFAEFFEEARHSKRRFCARGPPMVCIGWRSSIPTIAMLPIKRSRMPNAMRRRRCARECARFARRSEAMGRDLIESLGDRAWLERLESAAMGYAGRVFPESVPSVDVAEDLLSDCYLLASLELDADRETVWALLGKLADEYTQVGLRKYLHGTGEGRAARFGVDRPAVEARREAVRRLWGAQEAERERISALHRFSAAAWGRAKGDTDPLDSLLIQAELEPGDRVRALGGHFGRSDSGGIRRDRWTARARDHLERWSGTSYRDLCALEAQPFDRSIIDLPGGAVAKVARRALVDNADLVFQRGPESAGDLIAVVAGRWQTFGYPFYPRYALDRTAIEYLVETCALVPGHLRIAKLMGDVLTFACLFPLRPDAARAYTGDSVTVFDFTSEPERWLEFERPSTLFVMNYINLADQDLRFTATSLATLAHLISDAIVQFLDASTRVAGVPPLMATGIHPNGKHVLLETGFAHRPESRRTLFTRELSDEEWRLIEESQLRW